MGCWDIDNVYYLKPEDECISSDCVSHTEIAWLKFRVAVLENKSGAEKKQTKMMTLALAREKSIYQESNDNRQVTCSTTAGAYKTI